MALEAIGKDENVWEGKGREPGGVVNDACAVQPPAFQGTNSRLEPTPGVLGAQSQEFSGPALGQLSVEPQSAQMGTWCSAGRCLNPEYGYQGN